MRAIVSASGASTTFTKSNGPPRVAHWCSTLAPSSSTSWLTSRSLAGFAFSVWTPCAVRLDSRMYVGIAPPRSGRRAYTGSLVEIEQRGAEEEERRDDDVGQEGRRALGRAAAAVQQEQETEAGDEVGDRERRERPERMDVVRPREGDRATEGGADRRLLDHEHGHDEPDEGEPRERRQHEREGKHRERKEDERSDRPGDRQRPGRRARAVRGEQRGADVGQRQERAADDRRGGRRLRPAEADRRRVDDPDRDPERERAPEVAGIEPQGLGDELPDGAGLRRQRRRRRPRRPFGAFLLARHAREPTGVDASPGFPTTPSRRQPTDETATHLQRQGQNTASAR